MCLCKTDSTVRQHMQNFLLRPKDYSGLIALCFSNSQGAPAAESESFSIVGHKSHHRENSHEAK